MASDLEIAWAAGVFEGEGCFYLNHQREVNSRDKFYPNAVMHMCDLDIIERFHAIVQVGTFGPVKSRMNLDNRKPIWRWSTGKQGTLVIVDMFRPWLGRRRLARAEEVIFEAKRLSVLSVIEASEQST